jgi:hypothetical protein
MAAPREPAQALATYQAAEVEKSWLIVKGNQMKRE